jgi:hypothetical protein
LILEHKTIKAKSARSFFEIDKLKHQFLISLNLLTKSKTDSWNFSSSCAEEPIEQDCSEEYHEKAVLVRDNQKL